jgi:hypothetical protein
MVKGLKLSVTLTLATMASCRAVGDIAIGGVDDDKTNTNEDDFVCTCACGPITFSSDVDK